MKFEKDLHIINKTKCEKNEVTRTLIGLGFKWFSPDDKYLSINVSQEEFDFMTCVNGDVWPNSDVLTHQQFMEKYGMSDLKSKVEEAKKTLGLNNHELSLKLGHQKRYITNALLDPSVKRQKNIILKINTLLLKESNDLTHDFEGKALHKNIDDAMMISKSEYESMKKEIDHKTQIAEKHADMRNKAELHVSELEKIVELRDKTISQLILNSGNQVYKINELENKVKSLQKSCLGLDVENLDLKEKLNLSEQDSEKWQGDYWTVSRENVELTNSKRAISIWLSVSILVIVVMLVFGVLHFNGVV